MKCFPLSLGLPRGFRRFERALKCYRRHPCFAPVLEYRLKFWLALRTCWSFKPFPPFHKPDKCLLFLLNIYCHFHHSFRAISVSIKFLSHFHATCSFSQHLTSIFFFFFVFVGGRGREGRKGVHVVWSIFRSLPFSLSLRCHCFTPLYILICAPLDVIR